MRTGAWLLAWAVAVAACGDSNCPTVTRGTVEALVCGEEGAIGGLAADGANLFWTAGGKVRRSDKEGSSRNDVATGRTGPGRVVLDEGWVTWVDIGSSGAAFRDGALARAPKGGGRVETLASGQPNPKGLAVDAGVLFWSNADITGQAVAIWSVPSAGGQPAKVVDPDLNQGVGAIAVDAEWIYYLGASLVAKAPRGGGAPVTVASGKISPWNLVARSGRIWWTDSGSIMTAAASGGEPSVLVPDAGNCWDLAVDGESLYWTTLSGSVWRVPLAGGDKTLLASMIAELGAIAVDEARVYVVADPCRTGCGAIVSVEK